VRLSRTMVLFTLSLPAVVHSQSYAGHNTIGPSMQLSANAWPAMTPFDLHSRRGVSRVTFVGPIYCEESDVRPADPELNWSTSRVTGSAKEEDREPYHWKGLLLQSLAFHGIEVGVRIATADPKDMHILLNKPFWTDYWNSLQQFNMRRWNDGDSFGVNYIGHPMQGSISGYIEVLNDPRGRAERISRARPYWNSRFRSFLWQTIYSTNSEIGPVGEAGIFNEGVYTYPIRCSNSPGAAHPCNSPNATYTNNTGWVDFIVTPVVGTLGLIGEDAIDRYVTDRLVYLHPYSRRYKILRAGLNPPRSVANVLAGQLPWYRPYDQLYTAPVYGDHRTDFGGWSKQTTDLNVFYSSLGLAGQGYGCSSCRTYNSGAGAELDVPLTPYLGLSMSARTQPASSILPSATAGRAFVAAHFGLKGGYSTDHFAVHLTVAPGFASYSGVPSPVDGTGVMTQRRIYTFSALGSLGIDVRIQQHLGVRVAADQMVIRYRDSVVDPAGQGIPPNLSFLAHENEINSTNWGFRAGPVLRF